MSRCRFMMPKGEDTLWRSVIYRPEVMRRLNKHLTAIYALLKTEG